MIRKAFYFLQNRINTIDMSNNKLSLKWKTKYYDDKENKGNCMLRLPLTADSHSEGTQLSYGNFRDEHKDR